MSFAREDSNHKATGSRGWGPKALNYNALNHPEILASKPGYSNESALNTMDSRVEPDELNLSNALAAMLVDRIDIHRELALDLMLLNN